MRQGQTSCAGLLPCGRCCRPPVPLLPQLLDLFHYALAAAATKLPDFIRRLEESLYKMAPSRVGGCCQPASQPACSPAGQCAECMPAAWHCIPWGWGSTPLPAPVLRSAPVPPGTAILHPLLALLAPAAVPASLLLSAAACVAQTRCCLRLASVLCCGCRMSMQI